MEATRRRRIRLNPDVYSEEGRVFSVTLGTSPRSPVFSDIALGLRCIDELRTLAEADAVRIWAYCLMPDHVHLLLEVRAMALSLVVRTWKSRCYLVRRTLGNGDTFWQRSYFDHALRRDEDIRHAADYILANPVRKGLATSVYDYPLCGSFEFDIRGS